MFRSNLFTYIYIFFNKDDVQCCRSYRSLTFIGHSIKLRVRVVEARLREEMMICELQYVVVFETRAI